MHTSQSRLRLCGQAELEAERERTAQARNQDTTAKLAQSNSAKRAARAREMETTFGAASLLQDYQVCNVGLGISEQCPACSGSRDGW